MRKIAVFILLFALGGFFCATAGSEPAGGASAQENPTIGNGLDISVGYLEQARQFRDSGRYELARQAYAQALSTCRDNANLEIIKRELAGVELLIRTMR